MVGAEAIETRFPHAPSVSRALAVAPRASADILAEEAGYERAADHGAAKRTVAQPPGAGSVRALAVAFAMVMMFVTLIAGVVQSLIEPAMAPIIGNAQTAFWWVAANRDLLP